MVDHEGNDLRVDYQAAIPAVPRTEPLGRSRRRRWRSAPETVRTGVSSSTGRADFDRRVDTIEEAYEFFLAYASQGLPSDHTSATGEQIRQYLHRCDTALTGLGDFILAFVNYAGVDQAPYRAFIGVIEHDA